MCRTFNSDATNGVLIKFSYSHLPCRLSQNQDLQIATNIQTNILYNSNDVLSRFPCHVLLESLTDRGKESLQKAYDDLLLASTKTPLFGKSRLSSLKASKYNTTFIEI